MKKNLLNCCPYCSHDEGYFVKVQVRGVTEFHYDFDGYYDEEKNSHIHDGLNYKEGKYGYCRSCKKRLFQVSD